MDGFLSNLMRPRRAETAQVGAGLAELGKSTVNLRKRYADYVQSLSEEGKRPIPFEAWAQQNS